MNDGKRLGKCVIVESHLNSRRTLVRQMLESELFDELIEAHSMSHGVELVDLIAPHVCTIGPSIRLRSVQKFVVQIKKTLELKHLPSDSLALVGIARTSQISELEMLVGLGVSGVLAYPFTKSALVAKMHETVKLPPDVTSFKKEGAIYVPQTDKTTDIANAERFLSKLDETLIRLAPKFRKGELGLDDKGAPNKITESTISTEIDSLCRDCKFTLEPNVTRAVLYDGFCQWIDDILLYSQKQAGETFRARLKKSSIV